MKWQYRPRSDQHSKVVCWANLLDLLAESEELRNDVRAGRMAFGINHTMRDFTNDRKQKLDLVVCRPKPGGPKKRTTFRSLVKKYLIELTDSEMKLLNGLPDLEVRPVGTDLIALEAKAADDRVRQGSSASVLGASNTELRFRGLISTLKCNIEG